MNESKDLIRQYILTHISRGLKPPTGNLRYPFIDPSAGYGGELWDWDSYFSAYALCRAQNVYSAQELERAGLSDEIIEKHVKGSVLNFLDSQEKDGYTPIMVAGGGLFDGYFKREYAKGMPLNQHKPFLCQAALNASERFGDFEWFDADKLAAYMRYYETNQYDPDSGLFFWQDDIMIGIDNNPTAFFRRPRTCADVYLNSFIYAEYVALARIYERLGKTAEANVAADKAEKLKAAIDKEMWDEHDGVYYSQDLDFYRSDRKIGTFEFHAGQNPKWRSVPMKIRFWGCFIPMYVGLADAKKAERLCEHLNDGDIFAPFGVRTLARNEKMYDLEKTSNPSNWLGAVWTVANYVVYKGLLRYGMKEKAEQLRINTIELLGGGIKNHGDMFESYHPDTGEPFMHAGFLSFNTLVVDML